MGNYIFIFAIAGVLFLLFSTFFYNRLVRLREKLREAISGIQVQLKRRVDAMPRLEAIIADRSVDLADLHRTGRHILDADSPAAQAGLNDDFQQKIQQVIAENRSKLDSEGARALRDLDEDLAEIEKTLQMARRYYNALARDYNAACESFPSAIFAILLRFRKVEYFEPDGALNPDNLVD